MPGKSTVTEGYVTVVPEEIRTASDVHLGDILEWSIEGGLIVVRPRRPKMLEGILGRIERGLGKVRDRLSRAIARAH